MQSAVITITTAGTPQSLARISLPAQPTISTQGITNPIGGAQQFGQVTLQNPPGSTGNIYVGVTSAIVKATLAGVGVVLIPGASITIGNALAKVILDQVWVDADNSAQKVTFFAV